MPISSLFQFYFYFSGFSPTLIFFSPLSFLFFVLFLCNFISSLSVHQRLELLLNFRLGASEFTVLGSCCCCSWFCVRDGGRRWFFGLLRHFGACSSVCGLALGRGSSCSCLVPASNEMEGSRECGKLPTSRKLNFVQLEFVSPVEGGSYYTASTN